MSDAVRDVVRHLGAARRDGELLASPDRKPYRAVVGHALASLERLHGDLDGYAWRLREELGRRRATWQARPRPSRPVGAIHPALQGSFAPPDVPGLEALEVLSLDSRDGRDGAALLARTFTPDTIDRPEVTRELLEAAHRDGGCLVTTRGSRAGQDLWRRWVMVVLRDASGRLLAAGDGAVLASRDANLFYFSHVATRVGLRSRGLGGWFQGAVLQAAESHLEQAASELGGCSWAARQPGEPLLLHELAEIELPDLGPSGEASRRRLPFHGRSGRAVLWPLLYAQPDTEYRPRRLDLQLWNSVPMFLCHRSFRPAGEAMDGIFEAVELLFDLFASSTGSGWSEGVEWDRANLRRGLERLGPPHKVPLPTHHDGLPALLAATGSLDELLARHYPDHRYTRERLGGGATAAARSLKAR